MTLYKLCDTKCSVESWKQVPPGPADAEPGQCTEASPGHPAAPYSPDPPDQYWTPLYVPADSRGPRWAARCPEEKRRTFGLYRWQLETAAPCRRGAGGQKVAEFLFGVMNVLLQHFSINQGQSKRAYLCTQVGHKQNSEVRAPFRRPWRNLQADGSSSKNRGEWGRITRTFSYFYFLN